MTTIRRAQLADAEELARCHVAAWRDSYRPAISEQILANLSIDQYVAKWTARIDGEPASQVLIADHQPGRVIGLLYGGPERSGEGQYGGEIYSIYVLREFRRQGIGRKLFNEFSRSLLEAGISSLLVWVFEENPCRAAYAAWGGHPVARDRSPLAGSGWSKSPTAGAISARSPPVAASEFASRIPPPWPRSCRTRTLCPPYLPASALARVIWHSST